MKCRINAPEFITLRDDDDLSFKVRFDYDPGEEQWFDARIGCGSPGYPACIEIYEVDFGNGWEPLEKYPELNVAQMEEEVLKAINDLHEAYWADYDDRRLER